MQSIKDSLKEGVTGRDIILLSLGYLHCSIARLSGSPKCGAFISLCALCPLCAKKLHTEIWGEHRGKRPHASL